MRRLYLPAAILGVALVLRIILVLATTDTFRLMNDAADYDRIASSLVDGHGYGDAAVPPFKGPSAFRAPMYPFLLTPVYAVVGSSVTAGRLENAVLGTLAVAAIGALAYVVWGRRVALVALGIAAVYPALLAASFGLQYEALLIVLICAALASAIHATRSRRPVLWVALSGLAIGIGILTRETAALVLVPVAILLLQSRVPRRQALGRVALVAGVAFAVVAPWTIRNAVTLHAFVPVTTTFGYGIAGTYNPTAAATPGSPTLWNVPLNDKATLDAALADPNRSEPHVDGEFRARAFDYITSHPVYPLKVVAWNVVRMFDLRGPKDDRAVAPYVPFPRWLVDASVLSFYLVAALAVVGAFTRRAREAPWALWLTPLLLCGAIVVLSGNMRYRLLLEPFLVLLAALGLLRVTTDRRHRVPAQ